MLTRLEVIDDAIKIGLGAFIALMGVLATNRHHRKTDFRNRRLDVLQKAATDFQAASEVFVRLYASYFTYRAPHNQTTPDAGNETWDVVFKIVCDEVNPAFLSIHATEAILVVVGAEHSARAMGKFRLLGVQVQSEAKPLNAGFENVLSVQDFQAIWGKAAQAKAEVFIALKRDFYTS